MRSSELALKQAGIQCFATPTARQAASHSTGYYSWMLNGAKLYEALIEHYPAFSGGRATGPVCFETFPQAIACALAGQTVPAKQKGTVRRGLLKHVGFDCSTLLNIDEVDAALCAISAHAFVRGEFRAYGDGSDGLIVLPTSTSND